MPQLIALIPAYKPSPEVVRIASELAASGLFGEVVAVDDGSGPESSAIFDALAALPGVTLLRHAVNLGKGAALKTGFNHVLCNHPHCAGVVTLDADGQHLTADALAVGRSLLEHPDALVLGVRAFSGDVPLRSRFGNECTRRIFAFLTGRSVSDTQTGLRGIPRALLAPLLRIAATRYDFELEMLVRAVEGKIELVETPISTVYLEGNASSHFNPLLDSFKVYFVFTRFLSVSLVSFLGDYLLYVILLAVFRPDPVVLHVVLRAFTSLGNFVLNKYYVFKSDRPFMREYVAYLVTAGVVLLVTTSLMVLFTGYYGLSPALVKPLAELFGFFTSFAVQRLLVFGEDRDNA
ncbi:hypothetical protein NNJEOMEG_00784 [Fundidesulfovibrio magnetotacticus]|uniref:Glycosyltransferase n=1 Tax=Fundidesulfovibrio magnetotacticus TaxID=2730080 RepID=A0A6V8LT14_9BACT|nr:bifunctional glycosyltransferase family 2/GtrA family protein [Fundidesulfovibrio magnetotacticus]GFK92956.1 hypothetical protein NNJEOMEG_00784 [Fundidesulfovibrio magnetotacticus]